jgi:ATP-dependent Clp protease ATP-binding subunit ClpC
MDRDIRTPTPLPRLSRAAATALSIANADAAGLADSFVRSDHLLLGLLREGEGRAAKALKKFRLSLNEMRRSSQTLWPTQDVVVTGTLPLAPQARALIDEAATLAADDHQDAIDTEHLLAAILKRPSERACNLLEQQGVRIPHVMAALFGDVVDGGPSLVEVGYRGPSGDKFAPRSLVDRIFRRK